MTSLLVTIFSFVQIFTLTGIKIKFTFRFTTFVTMMGNKTHFTVAMEPFSMSTSERVTIRIMFFAQLVKDIFLIPTMISIILSLIKINISLRNSVLDGTY